MGETVYCCTYARTRTRSSVPGVVAADCCMLHTAGRLCVVADGRKPPAAAVVVTSYRSNECVLLLLAAGMRSCLFLCCLLHFSVLPYSVCAALLAVTVCCSLRYITVLNNAYRPYTSMACYRLRFACEDDLMLLAV